MDIRKKRKLLEIPADLAQRIEDYRFDKRHQSEMAAILELIEKGLAADA